MNNKKKNKINYRKIAKACYKCFMTVPDDMSVYFKAVLVMTICSSRLATELYGEIYPLFLEECEKHGIDIKEDIIEGPDFDHIKISRVVIPEA